MFKNWYDLSKEKCYDDLNEEEFLFYHTLSNSDKLKFLLRSEASSIDNTIDIDVYLNYPDKILLQFYGYDVVLNSDGTWEWKDTTG